MILRVMVLIMSCYLLMACSFFNSSSKNTTPTLPPEFHYYLLTLAWTPELCHSLNDSVPFCKNPARRTLELSSLRPAFEDGFPINCKAETLSAEVKNNFKKLYPNENQIDYEWEKNGACSGFSAQDYFSVAQELRRRVNTPPYYQDTEVAIRTTQELFKQAFLKANKNLKASSIVPICTDKGEFLKEVWVCFTKQGEFRPCSADVLRYAAQSCPQLNFSARGL